MRSEKEKEGEREIEMKLSFEITKIANVAYPFI